MKVVIGRLTLYGVTASLFLTGLASVFATLWAIDVLCGSKEAASVLSAIVIVLASVFAVTTLFLLFVVHRVLVPPRDYYYAPIHQARVHVGLTAWNDEECIGDAVAEFKRSPYVHKVVVVENNSTDRTRACAMEAGADEVITEMVAGYGSCCMRCLAEAAKDADVVILCEGDKTFSAGDIPKFLAYLENCDLVLGTRATQELRESETQMDWLINPANQIVAKLIQVRFWGTRLTDVGCTYRAMRVSAYERVREKLSVQGNHFSPHMYIEVLKLGMRVIEIPVVFRKRGGLSKGVGSDKVKAARVALRMLALIYRA